MLQQQLPGWLQQQEGEGPTEEGGSGRPGGVRTAARNSKKQQQEATAAANKREDLDIREGRRICCSEAAKDADCMHCCCYLLETIQQKQ